MNQHMRDLAHAGLYLLACILLVVGSFYGAAHALKQDWSPTVVAAVSAFQPQPDTVPTRISEQVERAREVQAALAKPIPPPPKLQPITAKLAYGHLRPGGKDYMKVVAPNPTPRTIPRQARDALAMQQPPVESPTFPPQQPYTPRVELHKVY